MSHRSTYIPPYLQILVRCLDDSNPVPDGDWIERGRIYQVTAIHPQPMMDGTFGYELKRLLPYPTLRTLPSEIPIMVPGGKYETYRTTRFEIIGTLVLN